MGTKPAKARRAVVFTTPVLQHPPIGGPALRIENSILALARISHLHLHSRVDWRDMGGVAAEKFFGENVVSFRLGAAHGRFTSAVRRLACGHKLLIKRGAGRIPVRVLNRLFHRVICCIHELVNKGDEAHEIVKLAHRVGARIVWFGYGNISHDLMKRVREIDPGLRLVCDTDSVWSRFILRELEVENDAERRAKIEESGRLKEQEEADWVRFCDVTTAVSEVDAAYYERLNTNKRAVMLFRNVINVDEYHKASAAPGLKSPEIFLAGSFWEKSAMEHAARWFIDEAFPRVLSAFPDAHVYIAGNHSDRVLADVQHPNVHVLGRVESVLPYLCHAQVALVPLFFESGTRFKILEAGACGIPVVSTTLGAEGIDVVHGKNILIADEPADFADAVVRILGDGKLGRSLGSALHKLVVDDFTIPALAREGEAILQYLSRADAVTEELSS